MSIQVFVGAIGEILLVVGLIQIQLKPSIMISGSIVGVLAVSIHNVGLVDGATNRSEGCTDGVLDGCPDVSSPGAHVRMIVVVLEAPDAAPPLPTLILSI